jgi:hypothetical protein
MNEQDKYLIERLDRESGNLPIEEASGPKYSHAQVVNALVQHGGFEVTGRESTPGAHKTWLDHPTATKEERVKLVSDALNKGGFQHDTSDELYRGLHVHRGEGFRVDHITKSDEGAHILVAHHRKSAAGREYAQGYDT